MWHVWDRGEINTGVWWENLKERDDLENLGVLENIKMALRKQDAMTQTGFVWRWMGIRAIS